MRILKFSEDFNDFFFIPTGIVGNFIICQRQSHALVIVKMRKADNRNRFQSGLFGCHQTPMTGNNHIVDTDQNRIYKVELSDGIDNLSDLFLRVCSGI